MTYQITYSYTDECGNEVRDIPETYEGSWEGLQGVVKQMREGGCYDIHADAVDDYEEEPEEESGMNWKNWTLNHLTDIPKIGKRERGGNVYYEYKMTEEDNGELLTNDNYRNADEYVSDKVTTALLDIFAARNPDFDRQNPREDIVASVFYAVQELVSSGKLYNVEAQTVEIVTEYYAEDGETYCVIKDGKGYGAIKKTDIVDGIVVTAYTGIDACAADTPEEVLKILRGRIKVTAWKAEGLSFEEIARRTKAFYESGE